MSATTAQRKQVTITTDGACLGNGQNETRAAAAAILEYQGHKRAIACYIGPSTNQRAEITAAAFALESLKEPHWGDTLSDSIKQSRREQPGIISQPGYQRHQSQCDSYRRRGQYRLCAQNPGRDFTTASRAAAVTRYFASG